MFGRDGVEVLDVLSCVIGITSTFKDGLAVVKTITQGRRAIDGYPPSKFLADTLFAGPPAVATQMKEGLERFGAVFAIGDSILYILTRSRGLYLTISLGIATAQLKDILISLQISCIQYLQRAQEDDTVTDFTALMKVSNISRLNAVKTLCELQMRMEVDGPPDEKRSDGLESRIHNWQRGERSTLTDVADSFNKHTESEHRNLMLREGHIFASSYCHEQDQATSKPSRKIVPKPHKQQNTDKFSLLALSASSRYRETKTTTTELPRHSESGSSSQSSGENFRHSTSTNYSEESVSDGPSVPSATIKSPFFTGIPELDGPNPWADPLDETIESRHNQGNPFAGAPIYEQIDLLSDLAPVRRITEPCSTNNYSGFCKGAFELQVGSDTLKRRKEMGPLSSDPVYWACPSTKCAFSASARRMHNDWVFDDRIRTLYGVRFRCMFLAKSHVQQKRVKHGLHKYICIFCVMQNCESPVIPGEDDLMKHISQHRGEQLGEAILHRTSCISDRLALEHDEFDINLVPPAHVPMYDSSRSHWPSFQFETWPTSNAIMEVPILTRAVFSPNDFEYNG